ncbi:MAG TPA: hypothetical protein VEU62_24040 [Bryobacterales bacterium]|nr:hypothetical protein [Bryobacterales bacterium]
MKNITRTKIYLPMAAMILTAALAIPAAAQQLVPFKGTFQGSDTVTKPTITTAAAGIGTLVGQLSLADVITLASACCGTGTGHWIAANGDSIDTTAVVSADFSTNALGYVTFTEIHTITSGTGGFTGAQGSFTVQRTHIEAPSDDGTHVTFGSFHGTITPPGAAQ